MRPNMPRTHRDAACSPLTPRGVVPVTAGPPQSIRAPVVQDTPQIAFALVRRHHFSLDPYGVGDDPLHRRRLSREHAARAFLQQLKQRGIADHPALDDLVQPRTIFTIRERREHVGIDQDGQGLMQPR
jgi:hypothetical protein